jgi:hypothetical protein
MMQMVERPFAAAAPVVNTNDATLQSALLNDDDGNDDEADVDDNVDDSGVAGVAVTEGNTGQPVLPRNIHNTRMSMAMGRGLTVDELLLPSPRQPSMTVTFPDTWDELQHEWTVNDLESFKYTKAKSWASRAIRMRYQKRVTAMKQLRKFKQQVYQEAVTEREVALALDRERVNRKMSLSKHIDYLHSNDNTIRRREPKKRKINNENNNNNNINT